MRAPYTVRLVPAAGPCCTGQAVAVLDTVTGALDTAAKAAGSADAWRVVAVAVQDSAGRRVALIPTRDAP